MESFKLFLEEKLPISDRIARAGDVDHFRNLIAHWIEKPDRRQSFIGFSDETKSKILRAIKQKADEYNVKDEILKRFRDNGIIKDVPNAEDILTNGNSHDLKNVQDDSEKPAQEPDTSSDLEKLAKSNPAAGGGPGYTVEPDKTQPKPNTPQPKTPEPHEQGMQDRKEEDKKFWADYSSAGHKIDDKIKFLQGSPYWNKLTSQGKAELLKTISQRRGLLEKDDRYAKQFYEPVEKSGLIKDLEEKDRNNLKPNNYNPDQPQQQTQPQSIPQKGQSNSNMSHTFAQTGFEKEVETNIGAEVDRVTNQLVDIASKIGAERINGIMQQMSTQHSTPQSYPWWKYGLRGFLHKLWYGASKQNPTIAGNTQSEHVIANQGEIISLECMDYINEECDVAAELIMLDMLRNVCKLQENTNTISFPPGTATSMGATQPPQQPVQTQQPQTPAQPSAQDAQKQKEQEIKQDAEMKKEIMTIMAGFKQTIKNIITAALYRNKKETPEYTSKHQYTGPTGGLSGTQGTATNSGQTARVESVSPKELVESILADAPISARAEYYKLCLRNGIKPA